MKDMVRFKNFQGLEFYAIPAKFIDANKKQEDDELDLIKIQEEHLAEELRLQKEAEEESKMKMLAEKKKLAEEKAELEVQKIKDLEIADALKAEEKAAKKAKLEAQLKELEE